MDELNDFVNYRATMEVNPYKFKQSLGAPSVHNASAIPIKVQNHVNIRIHKHDKTKDEQPMTEKAKKLKKLKKVKKQI